MTGQAELAAQILDGVVPIGEVPDNFADYVTDRIAHRPSPEPAVGRLEAIESKLDEILTLLRGAPE